MWDESFIIDTKDKCTNRGQDEDAIEVYVRVRPLPEKDARQMRCVAADGDSVLLAGNSKGSGARVFTFDGVYDEDSTQDEVFHSVGMRATENAVRGYNATIFAYGQTGSGKTHTMQGATDDDLLLDGRVPTASAGVIPRVFGYLFQRIADAEAAQVGVQFVCRCSYLEIYKETIVDLLDPQRNDRLSIREDVKRGTYVEGLTERTITSPSDAMQWLSIGTSNRSIGATAMNDKSSRSHSLFCITLESRHYDDGMTNVRHSRLNLIDLAGSERQSGATGTQARGKRLREAGSINKSLSTLGNVIRALTNLAKGRASHRHIPYRDSKLTWLLRDSLGGNSKTSIIATISPADQCFAETLSTLNFAKRAKYIKNQAVVNEDTAGSSQRLREEVTRLRQQLAQAHQQMREHAGSMVGTGSGHGVSEAVSELQAVLALTLRQKQSEADARDQMGTKLEQLQAVIEQKDKAFRAVKMTASVKHAALQRMRATHRGESSDDADDVVAQLQHELDVAHAEAQQLHALVDRSHEATKLALENAELREALSQRLPLIMSHDSDLTRERALCAHLGNQVRALMRQVQQLQREDRGGDVEESHSVTAAAGPSSFSTPVRGAASPRRPLETIERAQRRQRHEAELRDLQAQLESARHEADQAMAKALQRQSELSAEVTVAQETVSEMEAQIASLRAQHESELEQQAAAFKNDLDTLQAEFAGKTAEAEEGQADVASLQNELRSAITQAERLAVENKVLRKRVGHQQDKVLATKRKLIRYNSARRLSLANGIQRSPAAPVTPVDALSMSVDYSMLGSAGRTATPQSLSRGNELKSLKRELAAKESQCSQVTARNSELETQLEESQLEVQQLQEEIEVLSAEGSRRREQLEMAQERIGELESQVSVAVSERDGLREALSTARQECDTLESRLAKMDSEVVTELMQDAVQLRAQVADAEEARDQFRTKLESAAQRAVTWKEQARELKSWKERSRLTWSQLRATLQQLTQNLDDAKQRESRLQRELDQVRAHHADERNAWAETETRIAQLQADAVSAAAERSQLSEELEAVQAAHAAAVASHQAAAGQSEQLSQLVDQLQCELREREEELVQQRADDARLREELSECAPRSPADSTTNTTDPDGATAADAIRAEAAQEAAARAAYWSTKEAQWQEKLAHLQSMNAHLLEAMQAKELQEQRAWQESDSYRQQVEAKSAEFEAIEAKCAELSATVEELAREKAALVGHTNGQQRIKQFEKKCRQLRQTLKQCDTLEKANSTLTRRLASKKQETDRLRQRLGAQVCAEVDQELEQVARLRKESSVLRLKAEAYEGAVTKLASVVCTAVGHELTNDEVKLMQLLQSMLEDHRKAEAAKQRAEERIQVLEQRLCAKAKEQAALCQGLSAANAEHNVPVSPLADRTNL